MKKTLFFILLAVMFCLVSCTKKVEPESNTFVFFYNFKIKDIPHNTKSIEFWAPYPFISNNQSIIKTEFNVPGEYRVVDEKKYNNRIIHGVLKNSGKGSLQVSVIYHLEIKEKRNHFNKEYDLALPVSYPMDVEKFLEPSTYAKITPDIINLAEKVTADSTFPHTKARALYDYLLTHMEYNKDVPGWGTGNSERACLIGKGNCTDFHSFFNSLARASNIPSKFVIGFMLPNEREAEIKGYHCWAEFYINNHGWIPVDVSEAWKNKEKSDDYFGNLDNNRVGFTVGRDIIVDSKLKDLPFNFFIYPYVEIDGKPTDSIEMSFKSRWPS